MQWDRKLSLPANYAALGLVSKPSTFKVSSRALPAANGASTSTQPEQRQEEAAGSGGRQQQQQRASDVHGKIELVRIVNGRVVSSREAVEEEGCEATHTAGELRVIDCAVQGAEGREEGGALTGGGATDADYFGPTPDGGAPMEGEEGSHGEAPLQCWGSGSHGEAPLQCWGSGSQWCGRRLLECRRQSAVTVQHLIGTSAAVRLHCGP